MTAAALRARLAQMEARDEYRADTPEAIAARLTAAQRRAIHPGPGNPLFAKGAERTISALTSRGLTHFGYYVAPLTPLGQAVRAVLEAQRDE